MSQGDLTALMIMAGLFIFLGLVAIILDKREQNTYYDSLSDRVDTREFLQHSPLRPQFGALKIGGWIAVSIGVIILLMAGAFWLWS